MKPPNFFCTLEPHVPTMGEEGKSATARKISGETRAVGRGAGQGEGHDHPSERGDVDMLFKCVGEGAGKEL